MQDEKEEELAFSFDRVFYEETVQADVYEFLALPIVRGILWNPFTFFSYYDVKVLFLARAYTGSVKGPEFWILAYSLCFSIFINWIHN